MNTETMKAINRIKGGMVARLSAAVGHLWELPHTCPKHPIVGCGLIDNQQPSYKHTHLSIPQQLTAFIHLKSHFLYACVCVFACINFIIGFNHLRLSYRIVKHKSAMFFLIYIPTNNIESQSGPPVV